MKKIFIGLLFSVVSLFAFEHLTVENFDEKLKGKNAVIDFYAVWCPPCKVLAKNLIAFDKVKPENVTIFKVDIDQHMELATRHNIRSLPTLLYIKDGEVMAKEIGIKSVDHIIKNSKRYF